MKPSKDVHKCSFPASARLIPSPHDVLMKKVMDYLCFRKFIMPFTLQVMFWAGVGGTLYGTWWLYMHDNWAWTLSLTFGILITRLIFESFILRYKTYICLQEIREKMHEVK